MGISVVFIIVWIVVIFLIAGAVGYSASKRTKAQQGTTHRGAGERQEYRDPVITCDYCGARINTAKETTCPRCGATFALDDEWRARYQTTRTEPEKTTVQNNRNQKIAALTIMILAAAVIAVAVVVIIGSSAHLDREYRRNEKPNEASYDDYVRADYTVVGDGVVLDSNGVRVTVTGFYEDHSYEKANVKIEYMVENHSGGDVCLALEQVGINGCAGAYGWGFLYDWFKKNDAVTIYETAYGVPDGGIGELVLRGASLFDGENYILDSKEFVRISTTFTGASVPEIPAGDVLYEDNGVTVLSLGVEDGRYRLAFVNGTDTDYTVNSTDLRINGEDADTAGLYDDALPAGYVLDGAEVYSFGDEPAPSAGDAAEISFSFTSASAPEKDFSTGYLRLSGN